MPASAKRALPTTRSSDNVRAFVGAITRGKPSGVKGTYIKKVSLSSTMGPGVKLELSGLAEETRP